MTSTSPIAPASDNGIFRTIPWLPGARTCVAGLDERLLVVLHSWRMPGAGFLLPTFIVPGCLILYLMIFLQYRGEYHGY